jgi:hypothetical protein
MQRRMIPRPSLAVGPAFRVEAGSGIAVPLPGAADIGAGLEDTRGHPQLPQAIEHEHAGNPAPMMIASNSVLSAACGRSVTASESFIRISSSDVSDPGANVWVGLATDRCLARARPWPQATLAVQSRSGALRKAFHQGADPAASFMSARCPRVRVPAGCRWPRRSRSPSHTRKAQWERH